MARRDNPHARCTTEIPPKPKLTASLAAMMRRVRSSKSGHTERNFCLNSRRVLMLRKHTTITHNLIPLFIYTTLAVPCANLGNHASGTEIVLPSLKSTLKVSSVAAKIGQVGRFVGTLRVDEPTP